MISVLDAYYEGVLFPVAQEDSDVVSHGLVEHVAYRRPGADLEHTGRDAQKGTLVVPLLNGVEAGLWPDRYETLVQKIKSTPKGLLTHPIDGPLAVGIRLVKRTSDPDVQNGVWLHIEWTEDNASASDLAIRPGATVATNTPGAVTQQAAAADLAGVAFAGTSWTTVAPVVAAQLDLLEASTTRYAQVGASIAAMVAPVAANLALPALAVVTALPVMRALETLRASIYELRSRYLPDQDRVRRYTTPAPMALWQVAAQVYDGDTSLAYLIARANAIADPALIAKGTTLVILPAA